MLYLKQKIDVFLAEWTANSEAVDRQGAQTGTSALSCGNVIWPGPIFNVKPDFCHIINN